VADINSSGSFPKWNSPEFHALVDEWLKNERFVVALDAFLSGYGSLYDIGNRTFGHSRFGPVESPIDFQSIVAATSRRLSEVSNLSELKQRCPEFYTQPTDEG
jgi:hypothetical protein